MEHIFVFSQHFSGRYLWPENSQLVNMQNLLVFVNDDNVWLEVGDAEVGWDCSSSCGFPTWQITENFEF